MIQIEGIGEVLDNIPCLVVMGMVFCAKVAKFFTWLYHYCCNENENETPDEQTEEQTEEPTKETEKKEEQP